MKTDPPSANPVTFVLAGAVAAAVLLAASARLLPDAAAVTTAPTTRAQISPEAQAVLDQVREAYAKLNSLELRGSISGEFDIGGKQRHHQTPFTASYLAPGSYRHEGEQDVLVGSTGQSSYIYRKSENVYMMAQSPQTQPTQVRDMFSPALSLLVAQNPSLLLAVARDTLSMFESTSAEVVRAPDTQLGPTLYPTLQFTSQSGHDRLALLVDPQTHLVRQARYDYRPSIQSDGAEDVKTALVVVDYTRTMPEAPVQAVQLTWTPPPGARDASRRAASQGDEQEAAAALQGQPAPDFKLPDLKGRETSLAEQKGSIVVLDFWATWCPPCVESLPKLDELYRQKSPQGLKVFAINVQEDKEQVQGFLNSRKLSLPVLLDGEGQVAESYAVEGIPQTVVIGKDGVVRKVFVGVGPDTEEQLRKEIEAAMQQ